MPPIVRTICRCDHTWASYFHNQHSTLASRIFCLKDSYVEHPPFPIVPPRDLAEGSQEGFACAYKMLPVAHPQGWKPVLCEAAPVLNWTLGEYTMSHDQALRRNLTSPSQMSRQEKRDDGFEATRRPYGAWASAVLETGTETLMWQRAVGMKARPLWPVCYGGGFATTREAVQQVAPESWRAIAESMDRADNIEESHYMERTWAALLAPPLTSSEEAAIQCRRGSPRAQLNPARNATAIKGNSTDRFGRDGSPPADLAAPGMPQREGA